MLNDALIGHSGFVGSTLLRQRPFPHLFRSTNIDDVRGKEFDLLICAGAPAQKWVANREPEADEANILRLMDALSDVSCERFVLISTVDVFASPRGVDENTEPSEAALHPYGLNRLRLERFVEDRFSQALIIRLPGLVGPGLRKNVIYDLLNDNNLAAIDSRGVFQFYPMVNLWADIEVALASGVRVLHLSAAPIAVFEIARDGFGREFDNELDRQPPCYDFRSRHASLYGIDGPYQYTKRETLLAIRAYAQSERKTNGL